MNPPNITAVVATKNAATTLRRALTSLLNQTYGYKHVVIVDNMSSDATLEIVQSFPEGSITYISERDNGIYEAWNKALRFCKDGYIHFMGADDYLVDRDVYSKLAAVAMTGCDSLLTNGLMTSINVVSAGGKFICLRSPKDSNILPPFAGIFFSSEAFKLLKGFDESFKIAGDIDFLFRYNRIYSFKVIEDHVTINMSVGGVSSSLRNVHLVGFEILRACLQNRTKAKRLEAIFIFIRSLLCRFSVAVCGVRLTGHLLDGLRRIRGLSRYWT